MRAKRANLNTAPLDRRPHAVEPTRPHPPWRPRRTWALPAVSGHPTS